MTTLDPARVAMIVDRIKPHLVGYHPAYQGAAIANLLAIWLSGHHADMRDEMLAMHVATVKELVPVYVAEMGVFDR
jgi:hypothetical protein